MDLKKINGVEELKEFLLNKFNIESEIVNISENGFSRDLLFSVNGQDYLITWFCNQSCIKIGTHKRPAQIPFNYLFLNETYPLLGGNRNIEFSMTEKHLYHNFRIPI